MANPFTGKVNISEKDSLTVKNLTEIVKKLNEKASTSKDKGVQKKAKALATKYQGQINKTALLYRKNKHKQQFKGYKLNQLSYKKILELLNKDYTEVSENTVGGKIRAGLGAHPTENMLLATGAGMALVGALSKLGPTQKEAMKEAMKSLLKFLFGSPANAAITIGVGLVAGVVITKVVRNARQKTAAIKEQIENEALDIDKHEADVEKAGLDTDQKAIAAEAYKDPQLLEHIKEMAANSTGAYTPDQMANAQAILAKVGSMHVINEAQATGFAIQGALSNPENADLIAAFNDYNKAKKDPTVQLIEKFSVDKELEALDKQNGAVAFTDAPPVSNAQLDSNLTTLKGLDAAGIKAAGYIAADGTIDRAKVLAALNSSVPASYQLKISTSAHKDFIDKAVAYLETKAAHEIFDVQKAAAESADPNFKEYNNAKKTLSETDLDVSTVTTNAADLNTMGITDPTIVATIEAAINGKIVPTINAILADPMAHETKYPDEIIDNLVSNVPEPQKTDIKNKKDQLTVYQSLCNRVKQAINKIKAQEFIASIEPDANVLYDKLLETVSGGDATKKADLMSKYPNLKSLQAKFGANFTAAEQMLEEQGLAK